MATPRGYPSLSLKKDLRSPPFYDGSKNFLLSPKRDQKHDLFHPKWQAAFEQLCARVRQIRFAVGEAWPDSRMPDGQQWETTENGQWCGGHWVECLRIVGEVEDDEELLQESISRTERLRPHLEYNDMSRGHKFYYSTARQYATTRLPKHRTLGLAASYAMRSMAVDGTGMMPIGTQLQAKSWSQSGRDNACVDSIHSSTILDWWAFKHTGDITFIDGARRHLDASIGAFVNEDGSTVEFAPSDFLSGQKLRNFSVLSKNDDTCWARGQAWAIAGYLRAYEELDDLKYLTVGVKLLKYWADNCDESLIPPWDFKHPDLAIQRDKVPKDSSAAAIVVEQLARLSIKPNLSPLGAEAVSYLAPMMNGLIDCLDSYPDGRRMSGVLLNGYSSYPKRYGVNCELILGTAYLLFALYCLKKGRMPE